MLRRRSRRAATRVALASVAVVLVLVGFGAHWVHRGPASMVAAGAFLTDLSVPPIQLADGTQAAPLDRSTELRAIETSPSRVVMELGRGRAAFDVTPNPSRQFVVRAGSVDVQVLGTQFTVDRRHDDVLVTVQRGHVRVRWSAGSADLTAGQGGAFPPALSPEQLPGAPPAIEPRDEGHPVAVPLAPKPAVSSAAPREWRDLANAGEFAAAYDAMKREGKASVRDDAADLLLAADVARMSGHSGEAVEPLRMVLTAHRADPRASLAAFTLGRVQLDELGRPAEAAAAFADARRLAPGGALAQDALAREVEALSKAGDTGRARERATEYLRLYPDGRRARSVRRYGGVE